MSNKQKKQDWTQKIPDIALLDSDVTKKLTSERRIRAKYARARQSESAEKAAATAPTAATYNNIIAPKTPLLCSDLYKSCKELSEEGRSGISNIVWV